MASQSTDLAPEFEVFAADLIASGDFADKRQVLHAAMDALLRERVSEQAYNEACTRAASEPGSDEPVDGDIFAEVRERFGLPSVATR